MFFPSTPKFWYKNSSRALSCLNFLPSIIVKIIRNIKKDYKCTASIPVIAVGGCTIGGAGKTPITRELYRIISTRTKHPPTIGLRGYGRKKNELLLVDPLKHTYRDVGDEALMLSHDSRVVVGKNREEYIQVAEELNSSCIILDDGLEQRDLRPSLKILLIDGFQGVGNGLLFPIGPLRSKLSDAAKKSDIIIIINEDLHNICSQIDWHPKVFTAKTIPDISNLPYSVVLFSGLAVNGKFFNSLKKDLDVVKTIEFPDHYPYTREDITALLKLANGIQLVTTEKDYFRLPSDMREKVKYVPLTVQLDEGAIKEILRSINHN